jgi:hypothetical protein
MAVTVAFATQNPLRRICGKLENRPISYSLLVTESLSDFFKGALMPDASGHLIFYLNRAASGAGQAIKAAQKGLRSGFRKDEYEGYR